MDEAKSSGKLSSSDRKMASPDSDNIGKAKKKNKLKSPQSALGIKPKISESNLCKNIENRKFKRIRSVDDSDSSCDDEPPGKKPALGKNKLTTVVFGVSGHNEASDNMDTYEKNSEELRLEKYDDGVLKYFGYSSEEVLDTALKNTDCTKDSRVENIADLPDINLFSGSVKKKTDEKIENVCDGQHESGDEDDYIPGTADVLKNIAVDAALIQKVRDQNKSQCPGVNASDSMSQETVVLSSSIESCADILQNNILPSSLLLNDVNDATSLPGGKKTKSDGLETKTTNPCLSSATDTPDDVCPSGATDPCLTGTEQQLFLECDRSLRRVERALCSRDSTVSSCGHNTGSDKLPSKATGNSSTTDASDGFVHLLSTGSSVRMKSKDGRSSTSTVSPGVELLDKGDETTEDISHLSILSTQSEVISTQHRNKVQVGIISLTGFYFLVLNIYV
ncbi:hypothetical protein FHG87_025562 [Trinorchestia longiramus]|nr:hypothetical protein FHG87_025562 [Trinorchestia longiramus]